MEAENDYIELIEGDEIFRVKSVPRRDTENLSESQVIESLIKFHGNRSLVAKDLGISRTGLTKFIESHPDVEETYFNLQQSLLDNCETLIYSLALGRRSQDGGWIEQPDLKALMFILERQGASRGWGKQGVGSGATQVNVQNNQVLITDSKEKFIKIGDKEYGI